MAYGLKASVTLKQEMFHELHGWYLPHDYYLQQGL